MPSLELGPAKARSAAGLSGPSQAPVRLGAQPGAWKAPDSRQRPSVSWPGSSPRCVVEAAMGMRRECFVLESGLPRCGWHGSLCSLAKEPLGFPWP